MRLSDLVENLTIFLQEVDDLPIVVRELPILFTLRPEEFIPGDVVSYRGVYAEPAIERNDPFGPTKLVSEYLAYLKKCIDEPLTLHGYKGGTNELDDDRPIWTARDSGDYSQNQVMAIVQEQDACVLISAHVYSGF